MNDPTIWEMAFWTLLGLVGAVVYLVCVAVCRWQAFRELAKGDWGGWGHE